MAGLSPPTVRVHRSFLAAMAEFLAEGRGDIYDKSVIGDDLREYGSAWDTAEAFERYVVSVRAQELEKTPRPADHVPATTFWWVDGEEFLGRISIRHRLTPHLYELGGHIGYDVRPSARRRGHATAMLREVLPIAHSLGIDPALVTCDDDNLGSRNVIERSGGILEDQRGRKLRYWVPTKIPATLESI